MWQVENNTPFAADRGWVRDRDGTEIWLVAVKCTFDILPDGSTQVAAEQPPVLRLPEYVGEPGKSSLRYDNDLIPTKKTTDILAIGHAYAPQGKKVSEMDVGFQVGSLQKILHVTGNRQWSMLGMSSIELFDKMPIVYERAFGGVDTKSTKPDKDWSWDNPVGTGFAIAKSHVADMSIANIEYPNQLIKAWDNKPKPAGFGPICSHWQPRVSYAGTYDDKWMKSRQPLLPEDFDDRFYQSAPIDQQTPNFLYGGEQVVIANMSAQGKLRFTLPRLHLGFETLFYKGSSEIHKVKKLHTVILEPDFPRVSLVWHTALPCHFRIQNLNKTVISIKKTI